MSKSTEKSKKVKSDARKASRVAFTDVGWSEYLEWSAADQDGLERVNRLIDESMRDPLKGTGRPKSLKHELSGCFSRRINRKHRLVYTVVEECLVILRCRDHY